MFNISKINKILNGILYGDSKLNIKGPCSIENGKQNHISYIKNSKYLKYLKQTKASAIIIDKTISLPSNINKTIIQVDNPSLAFIKLLEIFEKEKEIKNIIDIHKSSNIDSSVKVGKNVTIKENVIINKNSILKDNAIIEANCTIGKGCIIGKESIIKSNTVLKDEVIIGKKCIISSGSVIGSCGFGLVTQNKKHHQIPHLGKVIISDNVLIGTNCTIDRGTLDDTTVGEGTKFDNQVHVGHNVTIGEHCLICAQVGIGGSTHIGNYVVIGGQAGIIDHLKIEDNVIIGPKSYVIKSIESNSYLSGNPARNHKDHIRQDILIQKLPEIYKKISKK